MLTERKSKRVIVLGATGSLGTHIAVHLKKCGDDVIAVGHSRPDNGFYSDQGIEYLTFDIADKKAFERLPQEDVWAVLNFAGVLPAVARPGGTAWTRSQKTSISLDSSRMISGMGISNRCASAFTYAEWVWE